jgi:hypothetical protein
VQHLENTMLHQVFCCVAYIRVKLIFGKYLIVKFIQTPHPGIHGIENLYRTMNHNLEAIYIQYSAFIGEID